MGKYTDIQTGWKSHKPKFIFPKKESTLTNIYLQLNYVSSEPTTIELSFSWDADWFHLFHWSLAGRCYLVIRDITHFQFFVPINPETEILLSDLCTLTIHFQLFPAVTLGTVTVLSGLCIRKCSGSWQKLRSNRFTSENFGCHSLEFTNAAVRSPDIFKERLMCT
jgi:hypothetical protein